MSSVRVSVILPALNEANHIAAAIESLRRQGPCEIIVVDGGSSDDTLEQARGADLVLPGPSGRSAQMNHGASHASGDLLVFLHADSTLAPGAMHKALACLARPGVVAACFRMRVTASGVLFRLIDAAASARVRLTGIAYGDQGLVLRRTHFERVGGFPPLRFMEDVFLSLRLRRRGRIAVVPASIHTSDRRWRRMGVIRQTLRNWTLTALAVVGVHPDRLASYYPTVR